MTATQKEADTWHVEVSEGSLSDGRRIVFYDERDLSGLDRADLRDLVKVDSPGELRYDALLDETVIIAPHRQDRTHLPVSDDCPLCPSAGARLTEIPGPDFDVVVFENRYSSLADACEVLVYTSEHEGRFADLTPRRVATVMTAWADRTAALSARPEVEHVVCFENRGAEIGVTLSHPHGQVYGYPFIPPTTRRMLANARTHRESGGADLFAEVLAEEIKVGIRVVTRTDEWTAFVPAAARWPFEVHIYPHTKVADLTELNASQTRDFAALYPRVLRALDAVYGVPMPYISAWQQAPVRVDRDLGYLHLRLFSTRRAPTKLKYLAASESAMGAFINDIAPESAAALLRQAMS